MTMTKWWIWPLLIVLLCVRPVAAGGPGEDGVAGLSREEALRLGEQMYRRGVLPSGEPMQALVQGDIPVDGRMFSCESCHLRSGLGSNEGEVVTLPTNAAELFKPFTMAAEEVLTGWSDVPRSIDGGIRRPAYTEQTLAEALSNGIDPSGREFIPSMPRYALDEREMAIMVFYLKNLAATPSPGVDATTMHLATVISDDLPQALRQAFLATLQSYVDARSGETRQETRRAKESPFFERMMYAPFRRLQLHVWTLKGPRESWDAQLQDYYRQAPVFAILSGMTSGDWAPVHAFCERQRLPCLFPITQLSPRVTGIPFIFPRGTIRKGRRWLVICGKPPKILRRYRSCKSTVTTGPGRPLPEALPRLGARLACQHHLTGHCRPDSRLKSFGPNC